MEADTTVGNEDAHVIDELELALHTAAPALPQPEPPPPGFFVRIGSMLSGFWRDNRRSLFVALVGTVALRTVTEIVGLLGRYGASFPRVVVRRPGVLLSVWSHWDALSYLSIAQHGYAGRTVGPGQVANGFAFAPLYPLGIHLVRWVTHLGALASAEILSGAALFVAVATLHRLAARDMGEPAAASTVLVLVAFPTAFFLLAPYPDSQALAFTLFAFIAARRSRWLLAGVLAAAAALTTYYLAVIVLALAVEVWQRRRDRRQDGSPAGSWEHEAIRLAAVTLPTLSALGLFMAYQQAHTGNAYAFIHAQQVQWHRHYAAPWTLLVRTVREVAHWRFSGDSVAGVTEVFDLVAVVLVAVVAVYAFLRVRRSYGVFLGLCWCVFTCQTFLLGVTRQVLVLFPLFLVGGLWTARRSWRERALLVLFVPCSYFLVQRFVTGMFAG
jgi:hypothetical protein